MEGGNNCIAWGGFERGKGNHPVHTPMLVAVVMWSIIVDEKSLLLRRRL